MAFEVHNFSVDGFVALVANKWASFEFISTNLNRFPQVAYLAGYLAHLDAKTVVVEPDYVDRDYLADYSSYYSSCFEDFGPRCKRLHFFSTRFVYEQLCDWITAPTDEADAELQTAYLGFVVARPLPEAVIGRTVLATYQRTEGRRYATRSYDVNLFGLKLVIDSLAYQQQDNVVAACATVALWTAFHKTSKMFDHPLPRPAEITAAANRVQGPGRAMPSRGLRADQIFAAIRHVGLEPVAETVNDSTALMSLLKGYLDFGLPVVLFGLLPSQSYAAHAIAVSGYSLGPEPPDFTEPEVAEVNSEGRYIEKIYAHDDNIGPFARCFPVKNPHYGAADAPSSIRNMKYGLQARDPDDVAQSMFIPYMAVVPVYGKVRITHSEAHVWIARIQTTIAAAGVDVGHWRWSLALTTTQQYKTLLRKEYPSNPRASELLFESQPRFMWRGVAHRGDDLVVEGLIDATGVSRSCPLLGWMWHDAAARVTYERGVASIARSLISNQYSPAFADVVYPQGSPSA